jgi:hypothetical protein
VQIRIKPLEASGEKPLRVSQAPTWQVKKPQPDVLYEGQYRRIAKKAECPQTKPAVVMDGPQAGTLLHVCRDEKCAVHARETRYQPTPQERAARAKELLAERVEKLTRVRILDAIRKKLPDALTRPDLEMAALDYFRRLGHDNHRRLCRTYGWEKKKTKAAWGGATVDYEGIAGKAVREMNAHDLQHFLVVCALVSDLYCPGYNPSQSLAKDSNLARTAARYKIGTSKFAAEVRTSLLKKKENGSKSKPKAKSSAK